MSGPAAAAALVLGGYLIGAVPVGVLVGRLAGGVDLRRHGSRRTGATNALRTLGTRWAALVLVLDVVKGAAAVLLASWLFPGAAAAAGWVAAAAGVAAVIGHNWSVFIGFAGGRGVATSAGGLLATSPLTVLLLAPLALAVLALTRYVSLGSILAAAAAPLVTGWLYIASLVGLPPVAYAVATGVIVIASHADNIARLRAGTERRIGEREVPTVRDR